MKKLVYSNYTKTIAALMFIASVVLGVLSLISGVAEYYNEKEGVYGFENDFTEVRFFSHLLEAPESAVFNAYHDWYYGRNEIGEADNNVVISNEKSVEDYIEQRLEDLYCTDKVNYYIKWNGKAYTNCGALSERELMRAQFYKYTTRDDAGNTESESTQYYNHSYSMLAELLPLDTTSTITVCTSIKDSYVTECKDIWEKQAAIVNDTSAFVLSFAGLALLLMIYLLCVCGKNENGEHKSMWLDNIWTEVHIFAVGAIGAGVVLICAILLDDYFTGRFPHNLMNMIAGMSAAIASAVVLTSLLSVIRNIKRKRFVESSLVIRILRWGWRSFVKIVKWIWNGVRLFKRFITGAVSNKTGAIFMAMLLVYTAVIGFFGMLMPETPVFLLLGIVLFVFAAFLVVYREKDIDEVKKGALEIRNGNLAYKIPEVKSEDIKKLASNINDIRMGLENSVSAKLKAERLKTELITNVSHDLKTPLTSIISYTELLFKTEDLPEEARDYIQVISSKSERLKNLTQDLFEISKVQSGNEVAEFEKLDVALLINQALGEHDSEIKESGIPFCVSVGKELYISADGRKMSRVVSNLIGNILKYTLRGTRAFITACSRDGEVVLEFKNIASYPMEFDAEEITGRFVRGDKSRTEQGNGLGLAIAKSYTELCNGSFEIVTDGDLFKAIITFREI